MRILVPKPASPRGRSLEGHFCLPYGRLKYGDLIERKNWKELERLQLAEIDLEDKIKKLLA